MKWIIGIFAVLGVLLLAGCGGSGGGDGTAPVTSVEPAEPTDAEVPDEVPPATTNQVRVYQLGDVVEFTGTLSADDAANPMNREAVNVRFEFIDNVYSEEGKTVLGLQTTTTLINTGEQIETLRHIWQEENGALFELTDVYGNYYMDSATNEHGIPWVPSPLVPFEQLECQCYTMYGGHTSTPLTMGTRSVVVGEQENTNTALGAVNTYPVSQNSEYSYLVSYDIYKRDESIVIDNVDWVSPELGIVKIRTVRQRYSGTGKLVSTETWELEAVKTSF